MKINVEFDLTPAEFRQSLGLPDVEAFQRDLMSRIQQQMEAGAEGYDAWSLMQPFFQQGMSQGMASFGNYQQMMMDMLRQAGSGGTSGGSSSSGGESGPDAAEADAKPKASASARSRRGGKA